MLKLEIFLGQRLLLSQCTYNENIIKPFWADILRNCKNFKFSQNWEPDYSTCVTTNYSKDNIDLEFPMKTSSLENFRV